MTNPGAIGETSIDPPLIGTEGAAGSTPTSPTARLAVPFVKDQLSVLYSKFGFKSSLIRLAIRVISIWRAS